MSDFKILIVDDESRMRKLIKDFLTKEGYMTYEAADGEEALTVFNGPNKMDLVLLDVMMPKLDGWAVCRELRKTSDVPIIMLTAKSEEADELLGFELGVDEFMTKPFSPRILIARIEAILRRTKGVNALNVISAGGIEIDKRAHTVRLEDEFLELSYKEFELLQYFMENEGVALSREKILNNVWNYDYYGDARTIDTHVKKLRNKLKNKGSYIQTIWGMGYKFEVE